MHVTRRRFLQGVSMAGAAIRVGLPPLAAWFTSNGTAYAAQAGAKAITPRFVFWFNGNGIPERYWIPSEDGHRLRAHSVSRASRALRSDIHVISSIDNAGARSPAWKRPSQVNQRRAVGSCVHWTRRRRTIHRSGHRRRYGGQTRVPLAANWRLSGVIRREHPAEYELGGSRPCAAAGDDSAQPVRPSLRRKDPAGSSVRRASSTRSGKMLGDLQRDAGPVGSDGSTST